MAKPNGKRVIIDRDLSMDKIYHAYYWWAVEGSIRSIHIKLT